MPYLCGAAWVPVETASTTSVLVGIGWWEGRSRDEWLALGVDALTLVARPSDRQAAAALDEIRHVLAHLPPSRLPSAIWQTLWIEEIQQILARLDDDQEQEASS